MTGLRASILSLFNISPDVNFMLRYVDEDGDLMILVDDHDLYDVMRQNLKFLRIDVHINNEPSSKSSVRSSGNSTPLRSPRIPNLTLRGNAAIAYTLKSVPELVRKVLSNLSLDLASKIASSVPVLTALAESISSRAQTAAVPLKILNAKKNSKKKISTKITGKQHEGSPAGAWIPGSS